MSTLFSWDVTQSSSKIIRVSLQHQPLFEEVFSRKHSKNLHSIQVFVLSHDAPWVVPVRFSPPFRKREEQNPKFTGEAKQVW